MLRTILFNIFINSLDDGQSALSAHLLRNRKYTGVIDRSDWLHHTLGKRQWENETGYDIKSGNCKDLPGGE